MAFITPVGCIMDCYNQVKVRKTNIFVFIFHLRLHLSNHHHPPRFHRPPRHPRFLHPIRLRRLSSSSSSASSSSSLLVFLIRIILLVVFIRFVLIVLIIHPPRPPRLLHPPRPPRRFCGGIYKSNLLHIQQFVTRPTRSHFASSSMTCPICFGAVALDDPLAWGYSNPTWHPTWLCTSIPSC